MAKSLKKNLTYQTIYQLLTIITPLITSPYLSRILGAESLGIYSFTLSIVNYFTLFAMLGITDYGCRTIAMIDDRKERECQFNEIYSLQLLNSLIFAILYFLITLMFFKENILISLIQGFCVVGCIVNIDWYFFGVEEFKITVTRNIIIKVITIVLIIVFVKKPSDIIWYTLIMAFSTFISQFSLWIKLKHQIKFKLVNYQRFIKHLKPTLILFIPALSMSIYHIMDKTMLGILSTYIEVGYYYNADKIINIPLTILTGISTVMLSRSSTLTGKNKNDESISLLRKSINVFSCLACAMSFGIAAVSKDFVPLFFGKGYEKCINLVIILSIVMIIKTLSSIIRSQYLIPFKKEKIFNLSVITGAITNLIVNYIMLAILHIGALGAVIGTVFAELATCIMQFIMIRSNVNLKQEIFNTLKYLGCGFLMFISVYFASLILSNLSVNIIIRLIIEVIIGIAIYSLNIFILWKFTNEEEIVQIIKDTIIKVKNLTINKKQ